MKNNTDFRFILVMRKSRLQELIERFNTWSQAKFYLEHNHVEVTDYLNEHNLYQKQLTEAELILKSFGRFQLLERGLLPSYQFSSHDIVVVIGQDGLVANTLKYLNQQPVIAINPDPSRWDGKLLPFEIGQLKEIIINTINHKMPFNSVTFAQAKTNDGQSLLAVNDLFIGPKSHTSARYILQWETLKKCNPHQALLYQRDLALQGGFNLFLLEPWPSPEKHHTLFYKGLAGVIKNYNLV